MQNWTFSLEYSLNVSGFSVELAGDIPEDLSGYYFVVIFAYLAVEPRHCSLIRDYIASSGGVVLLAGVPEYFRCYCKDRGTYLCPTDPQSVYMEEWFGTEYHVNTGGSAYVSVDNPFDTGFWASDVIISGCGGSSAAIVDGDIGVVAQWDDDAVFAFTREYGQGRLYYQATFECLDLPSVWIKGDVNGDLKVDSRDVAIVAKAFNTRPDSPLWDARADFDGNFAVDGKDVAIIAKYYNVHV